MHFLQSCFEASQTLKYCSSKSQENAPVWVLQWHVRYPHSYPHATSLMPDTFHPGNARRSFLRTSANAGMLGAALSLLSRAVPVQAAPRQEAPDPNQSSPSGYHETDHIRKYYAKARQF